MTMWLPNLEGRKGPVYRAIADALDEDIQRGALRAGTATWSACVSTRVTGPRRAGRAGAGTVRASVSCTNA